jgi:hypothetical protein
MAIQSRKRKREDFDEMAKQLVKKGLPLGIYSGNLY